MRGRWRQGTISTRGVAIARGHLDNRMSSLIGLAAGVSRKLVAAHLAIEYPVVFTFLIDPAIDATNWRAEQASRPAVVTRKVCGGKRTTRGAHTHQEFASVLRTIQQRQLSTSVVFPDLLRAPKPIAALAPPPSAPVESPAKRRPTVL